MADVAGIEQPLYEDVDVSCNVNHDVKVFTSLFYRFFRKTL